MKILSVLSLILIFNINCKYESKVNHEQATNSLFQTVSPQESGVDFINSIVEDENINYLHYGYIYNGSGVAVGDINNDGLSDLYFSSNLDFNKLYLNQGNFTFKDITSAAGVDGGAGYKSGVSMADINQDGWLDIFVCKTAINDSAYRNKMLYINNKNGTFTDQIIEFGLDDRSYTTQAYFFDSDLDGDLDVYFVNHPMNFEDNNYITPVVQKIKKPAKDSKYTSDRFYENVNGKFKDRTKEAQIENEAFGLSAAIGDFNNDHLPDIYVANDFLQPDYLYINKGNNQFKESFDQYFSHCPFSSMGTDYADINNDGCLDLMIVDMTPSDPIRQKNLIMTQNYDRFQLMLETGLKAQFSINSLQLGSCGHTFSDIAFITGTAYTDWSWSPLIADFDNDGLKDIFVTNGYLHDVMHSDYNKFKLDSLEKLYNAGRITKLDWINQMPSVKIKDYLIKNNGDLAFKEVSKEWNSGPESFSHGAAYADLDNDGDLDLVICNVNDPVTLLKNTSSKNYIRFQFDRDIRNIGATISLKSRNGKIQISQLYPTKGFLSGSEEFIHFGLGDDHFVDTVQIQWTDSKVLEILSPKINQIHYISYKSSSKIERKDIVIKPIFKEINNLSNEFTHQENDYIDFKREPLLLHKLSEEGPAIATGDINNDKLTDIFIGGAKSFPGKLLIQQQNGTFKSSSQAIFEKDKECEDVAAVFFDYNNDKLLDLLVVSGGTESDLESENYQDRLYLQNSNHQFEKAMDVLPKENNSGSCVCAADFDKDGDTDLFIGSRSVPGRYGERPAHLLLINQNGKFINEINSIGKGLNELGMVTDAHWADLDNNDQLELVVCGEFMPISIYSYQNNTLINSTERFGFKSTNGMWQKILVDDINGDGWMDICAGNLGLNTHLSASHNEPLQLMYSDVDKNGSLDAILCQKRNGKSYPIHYRDRLLDQMVFLKKKFTRYEPFSNASIDQIFSDEQKKAFITVEAHSLASEIFINNSGKAFHSITLPRHAQFSPIKGMVIVDFNNDNKKDLITVGNFYGTDAQFGRYDSSPSCLLENVNNTGFKYIEINKGGLNINGDTRGVYQIQLKDKMAYLISRNNSSFTMISQ
ncbi:MAG: VCBS repeat-containing protein [Saprospiraceae bacterium]|nr:VCBS repeat-containing protein [Saprospiraceae bacterium]